VLDGLDGEVNVKLRPVEVIGARLLNRKDLPNRRVLKPPKCAFHAARISSWCSFASRIATAARTGVNP
jgi:hypothetical protein